MCPLQRHIHALAAFLIFQRTLVSALRADLSLHQGKFDQESIHPDSFDFVQDRIVEWETESL
jgi:hypothetical protein